MAVKTNIIGETTNNHVTVEAKYNNKYSRYFHLNKDNADSFQKEFVKNNKKQYWISTGMLIAALATALTVPGIIIKDQSKKILKIITEIITGLALGTAGSVLAFKLNNNIFNKLLDKYDAKEIVMKSNNS